MVSVQFEEIVDQSIIDTINNTTPWAIKVEGAFADVEDVCDYCGCDGSCND